MLKEFVTIHMNRFGVICMSDSVLAPPIEKLPWPIITCFLQQAPSQLLLTHSHISPQIFLKHPINFLTDFPKFSISLLQPIFCIYIPNIAIISGSDVNMYQLALLKIGLMSKKIKEINGTIYDYPVLYLNFKGMNIYKQTRKCLQRSGHDKVGQIQTKQEDGEDGTCLLTPATKSGGI